VISLARYAALLEPRDLKQTIAASMIAGCRSGSPGSPPPSRPLSVVLSIEARSHPVLILIFAAAAGATFPPITVCMRTYFKQRLSDDTLLATAYSLESVLIELIFIVGPMLVALFVAAASAAAAVMFAAASGCIGTLLFLRSPPLRSWRIEPRSAGSVLGPLGRPGFPALIVIILCYSTAFGLLEIGMTAYATENGNAALAGILLGLMSMGSALGGIAYGSRSWHLPLIRQFALMLAFMGAGLMVLALPWAPWPFAFWSAFAGVVMAPALIIQSMLVAKTARPDEVTEAFTWSARALLCGVGIGLPPAADCSSTSTRPQCSGRVRRPRWSRQPPPRSFGEIKPSAFRASRRGALRAPLAGAPPAWRRARHARRALPSMPRGRRAPARHTGLA